MTGAGVIVTKTGRLFYCDQAGEQVNFSRGSLEVVGQPRLDLNREEINMTLQGRRLASLAKLKSGVGTDGGGLVNFSINWTLGTELEKLLLTGTGNINATGNTLANTLTMVKQRGVWGNNL